MNAWSLKLETWSLGLGSDKAPVMYVQTATFEWRPRAIRVNNMCPWRQNLLIELPRRRLTLFVTTPPRPGVRAIKLYEAFEPSVADSAQRIIQIGAYGCNDSRWNRPRHGATYWKWRWESQYVSEDWLVPTGHWLRVHLNTGSAAFRTFGTSLEAKKSGFWYYLSILLSWTWRARSYRLF